MVYHLFIAVINEQSYKATRVMDESEFDKTMDLNGWRVPYNLRVYHNADLQALYRNPVLNTYPVIELPVELLFTALPPQPMRLKDKRRKQTIPILRKYGDYVLTETDDGVDRFYRVDGSEASIITKMTVRPIHLEEARAYIAKHHRHCGPPRFHKFSICLTVEGESEPIGVAIASTPKARALMDGATLEINRVCSDPRYGNACSKLYAQAVRVGRELGYSRFVSYTLPEESGASLKAAGFRFDGMTEASARGWDRNERPRDTEQYPAGPKLRWILSV